jgi:UDP-N-acetylglucosamine--N-acetylmuramyl-(pentapeptide) pyrophosphoryl-undecaprenol N-acetylglucosamine transferase
MTDRRTPGPRVVLCGGGTGGHVYPALAVAEEVRRLAPEARLLYIGGDRMEARAVPAAGLPFRAISVHGIAGRGFTGLARRGRALAEVALGIPLIQSMRLLRGFGAQVVIGTGGYVTGPVLLAARLLGIPSVALEGNRTPGWTSRVISRMVSAMAVGWADQAPFFESRVRRGSQVVVTGLPVRRALVELSREQGAAELGLNPSLTTVLVLGGSLGSRRINEAVVEALRFVGNAESRLRLVQIIHQTGDGRGPALPPEEAETIAPHYHAFPFLDKNYPHALAAADLIVARCGSSTVAEVVARGLPMIAIPWSRAATGEQVYNVEPLARAGAAVVIRDQELTGERLGSELWGLLWNQDKLGLMARSSRLLGKPNAGETVAKLALELVRRAGAATP